MHLYFCQLIFTFYFPTVKFRMLRVGVCQEVDVRFIEYMPFDGNKWNQRKMVPYTEMISRVRSRYPDLIRLTDSASDTSKVCILYFVMLFLQFNASTSLDLPEAWCFLPVHSSVNRFLNTMLWKQMNQFWCKLAQVVHGARAWNERHWDKNSYKIVTSTS